MLLTPSNNYSGTGPETAPKIGDFLMKAIVITRPGGPDVLEIQNLPEPRPGPDQILVRVRATALNRADILQRQGHYPPPAGVRSDVPGLEFSGEVEAVGARVTGCEVGSRVMGLLPGESYAEKIVTWERLALPIPDEMSFVEATAIPEVFLTAYDALLLQARLKAGEAVLIHGVGSGVGTAAVQIARLAGAKTFGTASSDQKLSRATELGLDIGINYKREDFSDIVREHTSGRGVDVVLDVVGGPYVEKNLGSLAPLGRLMLVGLLGGPTASVDLARIMVQRLRILGTVLRPRPLEEKIALSQKFQALLLPLFSQNRLKPVVDRVFPLEEAARAHTYLEENQSFGKVVLEVS